MRGDERGETVVVGNGRAHVRAVPIVQNQIASGSRLARRQISRPDMRCLKHLFDDDVRVAYDEQVGLILPIQFILGCFRRTEVEQVNAGRQRAAIGQRQR